MLDHVGDMLAPSGLKLAPRWLKIALCWLKLVPRCQKRPKNRQILFQKVSEVDAFKAPEKQKTLENVGPEANREKTTMKLKHINFEPILDSFWPHLGVLGRTLEAILGILGPT